ncbi:hypothetical protein, partial [Escherichia coli]|uniref:hypothetical protein n=1 Tax=Escherichia coli TaxID=562 RepID=UPI00098A5E00
HAFSSGAGRTSDGNGSHASTLKSPSYTKSVSWQHYRNIVRESVQNSVAREKFYSVITLFSDLQNKRLTETITIWIVR